MKTNVTSARRFWNKRNLSIFRNAHVSRRMMKSDAENFFLENERKRRLIRFSVEFHNSTPWPEYSANRRTRCEETCCLFYKWKARYWHVTKEINSGRRKHLKNRGWSYANEIRSAFTCTASYSADSSRIRWSGFFDVMGNGAWSGRVIGD